jgi:hypothetical protein
VRCGRIRSSIRSPSVLAFRFGGEDGRDTSRTGCERAADVCGRTTSCSRRLPPVSFGDFKTWLGNRHFDADELRRRFSRSGAASFRPSRPGSSTAAALDNKPFGPAIEAIRSPEPRSRPAAALSGPIRAITKATTETEHDHGSDRSPGPPSPSRSSATCRGRPANERGTDKDTSRRAGRRLAIGCRTRAGWSGPCRIPPIRGPRLAQLRERLGSAAREQATTTATCRLRSAGLSTLCRAACAVRPPPDSSHAHSRRVIAVSGRAKGSSIGVKESIDRNGSAILVGDLDYAERRCAS